MEHATIIMCDYCDDEFVVDNDAIKDLDKVFCPYCMSECWLEDEPFIDNSEPISLGTPMGHTIIDEVLPENDPDFKGIIIRSKE